MRQTAKNQHIRMIKQIQKAEYMRFLRLKKISKRSDGSTNRGAFIIDSPRRFAPDSARKTKAMSKKKCQLITGAHDSGKSRWLSRLQDAHFELYGSKAGEPVFLSALQPLSSWIDCEHVQKWHDDVIKKSDGVTPKDQKKNTQWRSLNQHQRAERLSEYLEATGAVLYIDDAHKLTGRKCQIARQCMLNTKIWIMATSDENRLPPNIRTIVERREPQRTRLESQASYDSTVVFMWVLAAILAMAGAWEVAAVIASLNVLGSGRRSARAD